LPVLFDFLSDKNVIKSKIVLIAGEFSASA